MPTFSPTFLPPRPPSFNEAATSDKTLWLRGYPLLDPGGINQIDRISRKRLRSMRAVVDTVEALIKALFKSGELANTYFVFTSDNGFHLGQHRLTPGKDRPFEEDMRVPLIIRGPGIPAGMVRDEMTLNVDFAPTMAEWAGATMPAFVDGRSLIPLLAAGQDEPPAWRDGVLWEEGRPPAGLTAPPGSHDDRGDPRVRGRPQPSPYRELRTSRDIYLEYLRTGIQELDDLSRAPYQLDNVAPAAPAALLRKLSERLGRYMTCAGDSCREVEMS